MLGQDEQLQNYQDRFQYFYIILVIAGLILGSRLWYLQILQGDNFQRISEENRLKTVKLTAPRGMIFDRNRTLILDNQPNFNLFIIPQYFRKESKKEQEEILNKVSGIVKVPKERIKKILKRAKNQPRFQPVMIKKNLTQDEVALIEMEKIDLVGTEVHVGIQRTSIFNTIGAHLLGYISRISPSEIPKLWNSGKKYNKSDYIGKSGLEQQWESTLRGQDGVEYLEVDAFGRKQSTSVGDSVLSSLKSQKAKPGKNIVLTIDMDLQLEAAKAFGEEKTGALVAMDPNTGEILSMLSWPSFDSTKFSIGINSKDWQKLIRNEDKPLRDKTIQDHYSPGSVFKIVSAIAGLEEGIITPSTVVNGGGSFRFGGRKYHEWKRSGFGKTSIIKALYQSVDVFFYKLATRMDIDILAKYSRIMGLGKKTGVALPGEISGIVPTREWKLKEIGEEWFAGETLSVIIGQGYLTTTPIQLANLISMVANGGTLYRPQLIKHIETLDGEIVETMEPEIISTYQFSPTTLAVVREGLEGVIHHKKGTARGRIIPGIRVAGKTGTVQVIRFSPENIYKKCKKLEKKFRHHGIFVAYAPVDDPKIAVAVVAEHACSGSSGAAPIAMKVIRKYLSKTMSEKYGEKILAKANIVYWRKRMKEIERQKKEKELKKARQAEE